MLNIRKTHLLQRDCLATANLVQLKKEERKEPLDQLWKGIFDPRLTQLERTQNRDILYDFTRKLAKSISVGIKDAELYSLINEYTSARSYPIGSTERNLLGGNLPPGSKLLPNDPIIVPIMRSGLPFGAEITGSLIMNDYKPEIVLVGHPRVTYFLDRDFPMREIFISNEDHEFLRKNTRRAVLIVDDILSTGVTMQTVGKFLFDLGFENIFQIYATGLGRKTGNGVIKKHKVRSATEISLLRRATTIKRLDD